MGVGGLALAIAAALYPLAGLGQLALVARNLGRFQRPPAPAGGVLPDLGMVSLLVPARDEAAHVGPCVQALLAQQGVAIEVVVVDDGSTDGSGAIATAAAAGDPRFRLVAGVPRPAGWAGKPWACHQAAEAARGDWLLFVDADTRLAPGAAAEALAHARATGADLVSYWPRQAVGTAGEAFMIPLLGWVLLGFLPLGVAEEHPEPMAAAANGQCLLFRREAYGAIGGHAAVQADLVEDVGLARAMKRAGRRIALRDAGAGATCRMYDGFGALWQGFRKNLYPAFGGRPGPFLGTMGFLLVFQAAPPLVALLGLALGLPALAAAGIAQTGLVVATRLLLAARLGQPAWSALLHPLAVGLLVALAFASWRGWAGGGVRWKGRVYDATGAVAG